MRQYLISLSSRQQTHGATNEKRKMRKSSSVTQTSTQHLSMHNTFSFGSKKNTRRVQIAHKSAREWAFQDIKIK